MKTRISSLIGLLSLLLILNSCMDFQMVKFNGIQDFKMPKMDEKEILLNLGLKIDNPNKFNLKIKPSQVKVFVEEKFMGTVRLDNKIKFIKRSEGIYDTKIRIKLEKGAFFSLMKYTLKKEIPVRFEGVVKGSVYGITKRVKVNQTQVLDGSKFKMDSFFKKDN
jgi:LEA14-like dessication related protein